MDCLHFKLEKYQEYHHLGLKEWSMYYKHSLWLRCPLSTEMGSMSMSTLDPRESSIVPREVQEAAIARARALSIRDYKNADALHRSIVDAAYRVITSPNGEETLARKHRIRLRGIDAPENEMPYGKDAREVLLRLGEGKRLKVSVYGNDQYGLFVGDVHCNGIFVQEKMLKRGLAWYYAAYDQRPELAAVHPT